MREPVHVITEDYEHYRDRKEKEYKRHGMLTIFIIIIIIIFGVIIQNKISSNTEKQQATIQTSTPTPIKNAELNCGMSKNEVISILGEPDTKNVSGLTEIFNYNHLDKDVGISIQFFYNNVAPYTGLAAVHTYLPDNPQYYTNRLINCAVIDGVLKRLS